MPQILIYTEDGRESVNSSKVPLLAEVKKTVGNSTNTISTKMFPVTTANHLNNAIKYAKENLAAYPDRVDEFAGLVFAKPNEMGNGLMCYGVYHTTNTNTNYAIADLTGTNNYKVDIVLAHVDSVIRPRGYINVYDDTPEHNMIWSLETFRCGINVVARTKFTQASLAIPIPSWVNKNNLYISVPHSIIYNEDNGRDPTFDVSEIGFQIIGNTAHVRCFRGNEIGLNQPPFTQADLILAEINKSLTTEIIGS